MKKRLLAFLLVLMMVVSVAGTSAFAAPASTVAVDTATVTTYKDVDSLGLNGTIVVYPRALETSDEQFPVIAWANGTGCITQLYYKLFELWAEMGYVVVSDTNVMTGDGNSVVASIDYITAKNADPDSVFYGKIDLDAIGASGHSQGGKAVVNAAAKDSRIKCIFSIAGSSMSSESKKVTCPAFYAAGTGDLIVLASLWVKPSYNGSSGPAVYAALKMAPHTTCIIVPDKIAYYGGLWFDLYLKGQSDLTSVFTAGGQLSNDSNWSGFACKGF
ncbi:MAG: hypothetical protein HUJ66_00825 [Oscillospiraceae bacterium]|nr:hypothetical protein [Oscillospiraceae bacterium]